MNEAAPATGRTGSCCMTRYHISRKSILLGRPPDRGIESRNAGREDVVAAYCMERRTELLDISISSADTASHLSTSPFPIHYKLVLMYPRHDLHHSGVGLGIRLPAKFEHNELFLLCEDEFPLPLGGQRCFNHM